MMRSLCLLLAFWVPLAAAADLNPRLREGELEIDTPKGPLSLRFHNEGLVEAHYQPPHTKQLPSFTLASTQPLRAVQLQRRGDQYRFGCAECRIEVRIDSDPFRLSYYRDGELLIAEEAGLYAHETRRGFRFALEPEEMLLGGGQRVLGMDRRGERLPLYNKAHYGYTTESRQMYFSLPALWSSRNYILLFDNSAKGWMDLGKREPGILQFDALSGRTAYLIAAGDTPQQSLKHYLQASGMPPLPPRWALGHYASRFGYRNEAAVREVVRLHREQGFPLDAVVLDLYWFGPDIKGHMGNLAWDHAAFPDPERLIADLREDGVRTVLITEPFILTTSKRWQEAVDAGVLARDVAGRPKTFDFYFGNTGLIDVFDERAADWFWGILHGLKQQGVAGWWGDLGEPEVHPSDTVHAIGVADEIHNAYGHQWAGIVYERQVRDFPQERPFIMMRSGAPGSQRYGMIPWTGDVDRSWGGLKPQVELALQMGLFGFGYIHSDLGGFAGGKRFDRELYTRWLQFGVFNPVFRPHAQDHIPPEPVYHDARTRELALQAIRLRYQLLPYIYTAAWQHSTEGLPLMRPLFYLDPGNRALIERDDAYLFGDALLVAPVVSRRQRHMQLELPPGVWIDFFGNSVLQGGQSHQIKLQPEHIPVYARAGSFVPMIEAVAHTGEYSTRALQLHYYADPSVRVGHGQLYDDDGESRHAPGSQAFDLLRFKAEQAAESFAIDLSREGGDYRGRPAQRSIELIIHQWPGQPQRIRLGDATLPLHAEGSHSQPHTAPGAWYDSSNRRLHVRFEWVGDAARVMVEG